MERASNRLTHHAASDAEVRTEMRAVCVHHHGEPGLGPKEHEVASKVAPRMDVARREVFRERDHEPSNGKCVLRHDWFADSSPNASRNERLCAPPLGLTNARRDG